MDVDERQRRIEPTTAVVDSEERRSIRQCWERDMGELGVCAAGAVDVEQPKQRRETGRSYACNVAIVKNMCILYLDLITGVCSS